ncbi:hypothetical protein PENTCL1PPCAC_1965, partial [Pristionchus entomophagus]
IIFRLYFYFLLTLRDLVMSPRDVYEVEAVIGKRYRKGKLEYHLKWKGYDERTWVALRDCTCNEMIDEFEKERRERRSTSTDVVDLVHSSTSSRSTGSGRSSAISNGNESSLNGRSSSVSTGNERPSSSRSYGSSLDSALASILCNDPIIGANCKVVQKRHAPPAKILPQDGFAGLEVWTMGAYKEWAEKEKIEIKLDLDEEQPEMFLGKEVERIVAHWPYGEKPFYLIKTEASMGNIPTPIRDVVHGVECVAAARLFPKVLSHYTSFLAFTHRSQDLKRHIDGRKKTINKKNKN